MLISDIVRRNAEVYGDRDALVEPEKDEVRTWGQVESRTNQLARVLISLGVTRGDRVAMFAPNCSEYVEFYFACAKSGGVGVALNTRLTPSNLADYVNSVEPTVLLLHRELSVEAAQWIRHVSSLKHVLQFGEGAGVTLGSDVSAHIATHELEAILADQSVEDPGVQIRETDLYQIAATSGTTGVPKGVMHTQQSALAAMYALLSEVPYPQFGTALQNIPCFFNPGGPANLNPVLLKAGRQVLPNKFEAGEFLALVEKYQVTNMVLVPTMLQMILDHPKRTEFDLSSVEGIITGGSPLTPRALREGQQLFGDVFFPVYGLTETYASGLLLRREDQQTSDTETLLRRISSVGRPNINSRVRVIDAAGHEVARDGESIGEICLQTASAFHGYYQNETATRDAMTGEWFLTGDLATVDEEGFVTIVDRKKDLIISGGINISSVEVESVLAEYPGVATAAVVGLPHHQWGESVHACIVPREGAVVDLDELLNFASTRLAAFKRPRSAEIRSSLPINGSGKVLKRQLRDELAEQRSEATHLA